MSIQLTNTVSRRQILKTAGAAALAAGAGPAVIIPGRAQPKTLKILRPRRFVAGYDEWFNETYVKAWSDKHNIEVIVNGIGMNDFDRYAEAELTAQQGHDLLFFIGSPRAIYESYTIDHRELYEECEHRYGKAIDLAIKSTFNPKTQRYFGFCPEYFPTTLNYRKDLWDAVGMKPDSWEDIRLGGRRIKLLHGHPVGISLGNDVDSNGTLRALLYSYGAALQDADGSPALKSKATLDALGFFKALYEEAMTDEILGWDNVSNNRFMLAGEGSLTWNGPTITRAGENTGLPVTDQIWLAATPRGPAHQLGPPNGIVNCAIWKFARNIEDAQQFAVDYIENYRAIFLKHEYTTLPSFPQTIPDLAQLLASDAKANPKNKYQVLADALNWTTNIGYPGYTNPAITEIFNEGLIPAMFAAAATGKMTPEEAMTQADQEVRKIYDKWRALGKV